MEDRKPLVMDESQAFISGMVHSLQLFPDLEPDSAPDTTFQRQPTGGKKPYFYKVDNARIAHVNQEGVVRALRSGKVTVEVTDATGQSKRYIVNIPYGKAFFHFGTARLRSLMEDANRERVQLSDINDLRVLYQRFGNRWPLEGGQFWSTTGSSEKPEPPPPDPIGTGLNYYTKDMKSGIEQTNDGGHVFTALGRNL
ncbi:Ig-like domain-containing protein [Pseudomonas sp. LB3P93]